jgi:hypothetical protein
LRFNFQRVEDRAGHLPRRGYDAVAAARQLLPFVPAPVAIPLESPGLISAGHDAWNLRQQKSIRQLKNGNINGNGQST